MQIAKQDPPQTLLTLSRLFVLCALLLPVSGFAQTGKLNDTGQKACDRGNEAGDPHSLQPDNCFGPLVGEASAMPRQDGLFGRDAKAKYGTLIKIGAGRGGFDYTKVCMAGTLNCGGSASNAAAPGAADWACTRDNHTGLLWSLESSPNTAWDVAMSTFPAAANAAGRCGFNSGWRVPTARELLSIVTTEENFTYPSIDRLAFPDSVVTLAGQYWSSETVAPLAGNAWMVDFTVGMATGDGKVNAGSRVRLVRSDTGPPAQAFTDNGDGTVTDTVTGLMWDKCSQGQSGAPCAGVASKMIWSAALTASVAANTANYKGYSDWRLPNKNEMDSLTDRSRATFPPIDPIAFPAAVSDSSYWSSTNNADQTAVLDMSYAWSVSSNGRVSMELKDTNNFAVRLVRSGHSSAAFYLLGLPGAPVVGTALAGNAQATVTFSAPLNDGDYPVISGYTVTSSPAGGVDSNAGGTGLSHVITGLTNGTAYTFSVKAANVNGTGAASGATNSATPQFPLTVVPVVSSKIHGAAGAFPLTIDNAKGINDAVTVEPRNSGAGHTLIFQFGVPVASIGSVTMVDQNGDAIGFATANRSGNDVLVTLTGVPDNRRVTVTLTGVNAAVSTKVSLGFLVGDVSGNRAVNAADISAVKAHVGPTTPMTNFRFDVNASGDISAADVTATRARSGLVMP